MSKAEETLDWTPEARVSRTKAAVLEAGRELFEEKSVKGITVEEIARRTGIAKTTIYRHWPTREDLLLAIITESAFSVAPPDTGDPVEDIRAILVEAWEMFADPVQRSALANTIDISTTSAELNARQLAFLMDRTVPLHDAISRAAAAEAVDPDTDVGLTLELLGGPVIIRGFLLGEPVDPDYVDLVMARVLSLPQSGNRTHSRPPGQRSDDGSG